MKKFLSFAIISLFFLSIHPKEAISLSAKPEGPKKYIRVAIVKGRKDIQLKLRGRFKILTLHTNELLKEGKNLRASVLPTYSGIKLGDEDYKIFGIRIVSERDASIFIDNRKFRGLVDIIREPDLTLLVVNHIDLEEYLCGVLHHEVSYLWPYEVLKAQAIASRTFALYQHQINREKDYDLTNTSFSQVYGGATGERYRTNKAVIATYGEVLTYNGKLFPAYYHATCGGHTQDASRLWDIDIPPLKGRECPNCKISPYYKWQKRLSLDYIQKKLNGEGLNVGKIYAIEPTGYDESHRLINLKITHSKGETIISGYRFRIIMGTNLIRSTNFKVELNINSALFTGFGWGHGVGMCQWGALSMALKGYKAEEILKFYYPQSEIKNIWQNVKP